MCTTFVYNTKASQKELVTRIMVKKKKKQLMWRHLTDGRSSKSEQRAEPSCACAVSTLNSWFLAPCVRHAWRKHDSRPGPGSGRTPLPLGMSAARFGNWKLGGRTCRRTARCWTAGASPAAARGEASTSESICTEDIRVCFDLWDTWLSCLYCSKSKYIKI